MSIIDINFNTKNDKIIKSSDNLASFKRYWVN